MICPHCSHEIVLPTPKGKVPLTRRQAEVLAFLRDDIQAKGYAPSFEEIADHFSFASLSTVHEHLDSLSRKGWIRREPNQARAITLLNHSQETA